MTSMLNFERPRLDIERQYSDGAGYGLIK
jgi:hypothetical protein